MVLTDNFSLFSLVWTRILIAERTLQPSACSNRADLPVPVWEKRILSRYTPPVV